METSTWEEDSEVRCVLLAEFIGMRIEKLNSVTCFRCFIVLRVYNEMVTNSVLFL